MLLDILPQSQVFLSSFLGKYPMTHQKKSLSDMYIAKNHDTKKYRKTLKIGLKISQLGKYFFATGKFLQPSCEKISPQLGYFCILKNCDKVTKIPHLQTKCKI